LQKEEKDVVIFIVNILNPITDDFLLIRKKRKKLKMFVISFK